MIVDQRLLLRNLVQLPFEVRILLVLGPSKDHNSRLQRHSSQGMGFADRSGIGAGDDRSTTSLGRVPQVLEKDPQRMKWPTDYRSTALYVWTRSANRVLHRGPLERIQPCPAKAAWPCFRSGPAI